MVGNLQVLLQADTTSHYAITINMLELLHSNDQVGSAVLAHPQRSTSPFPRFSVVHIIVRAHI